MKKALLLSLAVLLLFSVGASADTQRLMNDRVRVKFAEAWDVYKTTDDQPIWFLPDQWSQIKTMTESVYDDSRVALLVCDIPVCMAIISTKADDAPGGIGDYLSHDDAFLIEAETPYHKSLFKANAPPLNVLKTSDAKFIYYTCREGNAFAWNFYTTQNGVSVDVTFSFAEDNKMYSDIAKQLVMDISFSPGQAPLETL